MDTLEVVRHWPFIEQNLDFHRWRAGQRALRLLVQLQNEHAGEFVHLGPKRLRELGLKPGEVGGVWRSLVDLESRRVVGRRRGAGRMPDTWGLRPDVTHWRSMPWTGRARDVEATIVGCTFCFAKCAVASRNPGQRPALFLMSEKFAIPEELHVPESHEISRSYGNSRATTPSGRAWEPVDSRDNGAEIEMSQAPPTVSSVVLEELLLKTDGAAERHALFVELLDRRSKPGDFVRPRLEPDQDLMHAAIELTTGGEAIEAKARWGALYPRGTECRVPSGASDLLKIARAIVAERATILEA